MGLDALLTKLENRKPATPETPCNLAGVTANPALSLACTPETPATPQIDSGGSDARKATATASHWWLLHYPDREPVEVASFPPATHAEVLKLHPNAIAAEPFDQAEPEPARDCATCTHVTGRGGFGEPVAAGLSDVVGVIRYSPDQGVTCPAWLATIPNDLEHLIVRAGAFWEYSPDDFALIREVARRDPDGLRKALENDVAFNRGG